MLKLAENLPLKPTTLAQRPDSALSSSRQSVPTLRQVAILALIQQARTRDGLPLVEISETGELGEDAELALSVWQDELEGVPDSQLAAVFKLAKSLQGTRQYFAPALLGRAWQQMRPQPVSPPDDSEARWEAAYARVDRMSAEEIAATTPEILAETERRLRERGSHARVADWSEDVVRDHVRAVLARRIFEEVQC